MPENKKDSEILAEIYRNAQLAITSIVDILPSIVDSGIREEVLREHEEYEKICSRAAEIALKKNIDIKEPGAMKKAMMWSAIKMNAAVDNSAQHIAAMMIRGTVTGITSLKTSQTDAGSDVDIEIAQLLRDIIALEEANEKKLKKFL